jgi:hypothetical protein
MKKQLTIFLVLFLMFAATAQEQVTSGKVQRFENFKSKLIDARNIDVWLPMGILKKKNMPFCICMTVKRYTIHKALGINKLGKLTK